MIARFIAALLLLSACGCGSDTMRSDGRVKPYEPSAFFTDGQSARHHVANTVPRGASSHDPSSGHPEKITREYLERGQRQFNIYCAPCHGMDGYGKGIIVRRGLTMPPSFHTEKLRSEPDEHYYRVITDGWGAMYSYANRVKPQDRWAIAAYIRALQLSQHAQGERAGARDANSAALADKPVAPSVEAKR
jgi:cytochrome c553